MSKFFYLSLLSVLFFISCEPDSTVPDKYQPKGNYDSGVLVLNEGGFQSGNASLSFISFDLNATKNNIFSAVNNGAALGDTAQSIGFNGDLAYIVVNYSNKIEVVNRYTMVKVATITSGLDSPRYITFSNGKGYVTNWAAPSAPTPREAFVGVINLASNTVESKIACAANPEKIIENQGKLYVAHDNYATGNIISTINTATSSIEGTPIEVEYGPNSLTIVDSYLWVSCSGKVDTSGKVFKINLSDKSINKIYTYSSNTDHIDKFQIYGNYAYFTKTSDSKIYRIELSQVATSLPSTSLFTSEATTIYGLGLANNKIYIADAKDYSSSGSVYVYSLGSDGQSLGALLKNTAVGVIPNGFYFNQ